MKRTFSRASGAAVVALASLLVLIPMAAHAQVPQTISYQGSLTDASGNPVDGVVNITFNLYDNPDTAFGLQWTETQSVPVTNGAFAVILGADTVGNPLTQTLFEIPLFLGLAVGGDAEMTPRQALTAVGHAFRAKTVESDTLSALSCAADEVPKFVSGAWACAADDSNVGDITGVLSGTGLTGGGLTGDVTLSADTSFVQRRVSDFCAAGSSIRAISATGTVTCEIDTDTDTNTTYSAGSGLVLSGTTFSIGTNSVSAAHIATDAVGSSEVANNSLTGADIAAGAIGTSEVADNSLQSGDLAPASVGISELANAAKGVGINGTMVVPAAAFLPDSDTRSYLFSFGGSIQPGNLSTTICMAAPVYLPHGVALSNFEIVVFDNSTVSDIGVDLRRLTLSTGLNSFLASATSSGVSASVQIVSDNTIGGGAINTSIFAYYVTTCFASDGVSASNTKLYAARISY